MRNSTGKPPSVSLSVPEILFFHDDCPNKGSLSYTRKSISFISFFFLEGFAKITLLRNLRKLMSKALKLTASTFMIKYFSEQYYK